ncbi:MAG: Dot/Icm secretion system ATPase DotB [Gammaproteobacteria bacterium CG_4_10_14_0_8_um_filter_38_16]|nr:MAG: Dot/Icm secretion system ATPase DotB [Gammaproteobacteria bacterium CG_4_10_14_0_8_um_filter_38_16]PJA04411.1 MAG: Dot/Icm secretion system ATPase DotB [Gammaproteobacteria bacterium CG_4_10_14_0_2_um_filter_38_22]PJB10167.1 MAG: Dot/Icm secretion system ATPase DotB [Gammaproteobacteria bacterium CG_4_9_14_3_um_filter_38_9]
MPEETTALLYPREPARFEEKNIDDLLVYCQHINASDITIQTAEPIIIEVYGRIHKITKRKLTNTEVGDLLNALYGPNGTTQIMRGTDLDTHYEVRPSRNERYRFRVNGVGCYIDGHEGIQITLRTIPATPPSLSTLQLPQPIIDAMAPQEGVVYVTGATGSGKSTLLASIIKSLAEEKDGNRKILTYESPIEFVYDSIEMPTSIVAQSEIPKHLPTFADGVRNALRRKPHLILVGEARDTETISAVIEAALTGHPVYTTLHTNGVAETIRRLVGSFPSEERLGRTIDIIETLRLIVWQRLVPSVDGKRIALREYLVFSEKIRDVLLDSDPENITQTTRQLLQEHGQPMLSDVEARYKEGLLTDRLYQTLTMRLKQNE